MVKNTTLNIETTTLFKVFMVQKKVSIDTIIELYKHVLNNRDKFGADSKLELHGVEIHFSLANNTIYLEKVFGKEERKNRILRYTLTTHFLESLIDDDFQLSNLVPLLVYLQSNNVEVSQKHEIVSPASTIVFEVDNDKIRLITGWKGVR